MPLFDLNLSALETYLPDIDEPADFDAFWAGTLAETRTHDLSLKLTPVDSGLSLVDVFDVEFAGFGGHPIKAWLTGPATGSRPGGLLPAVVEYNGYGAVAVSRTSTLPGPRPATSISSWTPAVRAADGEPAATRPTRSAPGPPRRAS